VGELRVNVDDLEVTAARYEASAGELAGGTRAVGAGFSDQPSAVAVGALRVGTAVMRAALSARAADTGVGIAAADASYVDNEAASAAEVRALA
jgi:hypothetical protein